MGENAPPEWKTLPPAWWRHTNKSDLQNLINRDKGSHRLYTSPFVQANCTAWLIFKTTISHPIKPFIVPTHKASILQAANRQLVMLMCWPPTGKPTLRRGFSSWRTSKKGCGFISGFFLFSLTCFVLGQFFVRASKMSYFTAISREIDAFYASPSSQDRFQHPDQHPITNKSWVTKCWRVDGVKK